MFRRISYRILILLILATGLVAACTAPSQPVQSVDSKGLVQTVAAELEARQAQPVPTVDVPAVRDEILAAVEERLAEITPIDVAQVVREEVAAQLAVQAADRSEAMEAISGQAGMQAALVDLYRRANPAVVYIIVPPFTSGSGFVYDQEGHIVTNNHVVAEGRLFEVVFAGGVRLPAALVGTDSDSDLAVLKVDALPEGITPLPLVEPGDLQVGQYVVAIGNPFGEQGSMSLGIVSGLGRSLRSQRAASMGSSYSLPEVVQTDAPINPGNSGGPLLNLDGEVVGVNSAIASTTGVNSGVGFAIPAAAVRRIVPQLIQEGRYVYSYLGAAFDEEISLIEQVQFELPQTQGAYVISVTPGGPAAEAGLIPANPSTGQGGDLVVEIDGVPIRNFADLNSYLVFNTQVGQTIEVTVLRDGQNLQLPLVLGARP